MHSENGNGLQNARVYIVEDELIVAEELRGDLKQIGCDVVGNSDNFHEAIQYISETRPEILLLDVNILGEKNGIDLAKAVREIYSPVLIFLSAYSDKHTLQQAKLVQPDAYLLKPYDIQALEVSLDIAFSNAQERNLRSLQDPFQPGHLFIKLGEVYKKVLLHDLLYIEADGSYILIHMRGKKATLAMNLKTFMEKVNASNLVRIHRKYVVNVSLIESFDESNIWINKLLCLPVSNTYKDDLLRRLNKL